ncbi:hypothetical protein [Brevibacillus sp. NRS-1366]|uniref:hypothetical protein n=1 Tax=Brevibacillus sp. NRS-1366 TaxID=3233899 RepID=UPI003D19243C
MRISNICLVVLFIFLIGCQDNAIERKTESIVFESTEKNLVSIINQKINEKFGVKIEDFKVTKLLHIEDNTFGQIIFRTNGTEYEGSIYAKENNGVWDIINMETLEMDVKAPFTKLQVVGDIPNSATNFHIISGIVNDERIKSIEITYPSNESSVIMIDDYKSYFDVKLGVRTFSKVIAYDEEFNEVSSY